VRSVGQRVALLKDWYDHGGILFLGYEIFRELTLPRTDEHESFLHYLQNPGPDVVICDESHRVKNVKTSLYANLIKLKTPSRICLTGSPLQNNLDEYFYMVRCAAYVVDFRWTL
jgi:SNF2 family DNA or RNA helicase